MANRQTLVVGALGVLVGMVVGANSAQHADVISYAGHNPNSEAIQNMPNLRRATEIIRPGAYYEGVWSNVNVRTAAPRPATLEQNVEQRRMMRASELGHTSAPTRTVRGAPAQRTRYVHGCSQYTGQRYTHCLEAYITGEEYVPNYFPTDYEY